MILTLVCGVAVWGFALIMSLVILCALSLCVKYVTNYLRYHIWSCCPHPTWDWVEMPVSVEMTCFFRQCPNCGALEYQQWRYLLLSPHED
jgi:hypothetical protein